MSNFSHGIRKIIFGGSIAVLVLLVCFGAFCYYVVTKSFPKVEGSIGGVEVSSPVLIYRDLYGVPHAMAATEEDGYAAIGYLHAQDRLFQMDLARRAGEGRLSEIFGTKAIPLDAMFRTIGIRRIAARIAAKLPTQTRRIFEAYSRGVNAYIAQHQHTMPVEFDVLNYKPDPWDPLHCVIIMRLLAWEMNFGWWTDITVQDVINRVGVKSGLELFPQYPSDAPTILRDEHAQARRDLPTAAPHDSSYARGNANDSAIHLLHEFASLVRTGHDVLGLPLLQSGSNAWAIASNRTLRGKPILCNDPHLLITTPSRWYQVHMHAGSTNIAGLTIPGFPFVIIGRNDAVAWGITNAMIDDCDFVVEKIDSASPTRYLSHGVYKEMHVRVDTIHVKDTENVEIKIYDTDHGPIISAIHPFVTPPMVFDAPVSVNAKSIFSGAAIAMHWMGNEESDESTALYKASHGRTGKELADALSTSGVPAQNIIYADTLGNIGYVLAGRVPVRDVPYPGVSAPVSGAQDNMIWSGTLPTSQNLRFQNPKSGIVASANNKIAADMPVYISNFWEPPSRIQRVHELLEAHAPVGVEEMKKYQNDLISPHALDATRYILAAFTDSATQQPLVKQALTYLANWDGSMAKEEIAASVFNSWLARMFEAMWKERLGSPVYEEYVLLQGTAYRALTSLLRSSQSDWFDDPRTGQREGRDEMIRRCMLEALQDLTARFNSTEIKRWQWGELHHMTFKHVLGRVKPLDKVLNIGPFPSGGSLTTINNAEFEFIHLFESTLGPSMRMICDLSTKHMLNILTGGVSGQPFSPHYSDQTPLWRNGGYLEITLDPNEIPQAGWTKVLLER